MSHSTWLAGSGYATGKWSDQICINISLHRLVDISNLLFHFTMVLTYMYIYTYLHVFSPGYLRGFDVTGETSILVTNQAQTFHWTGYGLKLHIPQGALPAGLEECRLLIKVGLSGQFKLPEDTSLVSAVYWVDSDPRCKFSQPITLEMQHCMKQTHTSKLSFVHAKCSQEKLPYTFEEAKEEGVFSTKSTYGCVQLTHFSIWSIIMRLMSGQYRARLYYLRRGVNWIDIHFVITKDLDVHAKVSFELYCTYVSLTHC